MTDRIGVYKANSVIYTSFPYDIFLDNVGIIFCWSSTIKILAKIIGTCQLLYELIP